MASIEAALTAAVTGDATVSGLIGTRFFLTGSAQAKTYPYVTYQRISTAGADYLDGDANLEWPRFQIDVWAKDASDGKSGALIALEVAEAIRSFLCPTPTVERAGAGLSFTAKFQDQRGPTLDEETRNFGCSQDYFLTYERS
jgi:hypothetical protein